MQLSKLLMRLPDGALSSTSFADPAAEVYNISFLTPSACDLRQDALYFGDVSLLPPEMPASRVFSCVAYGTGEVPPHLLDHHNVNLAMVAPGQDPFACYNRLQEFFVEDVAVTDRIRRMLSALLTDNGLQYLVEEGSKAMGNPLMVVDAGLHYIARSIELAPDDDSRFAQVMRQELQFDSVLEDGASYIRDSGIDDRLARTRRPILLHNEHLGCNTLVGTVTVHGICLAHVTMAETQHPFGSLDEECFARFVLFVGQQLQKTPLYEVSGNQSEAYFLVSLLEDDQPSPAVVRRRLSVLEFSPLPVLYAVVLAEPSRRMTAHDTENVAGQLAGALHNGIHACYEGELVVLLSRAEGDELDEATVQALARTANLNGLSCGISNPFGDLVDIRRFWGQARCAIRCGGRFASALDDHSVFRYRDYAYVDLLDVANRSMSLLDLCEPKLMRLVRHDEQHGGELTETLFEYLQSAQSTTRAAKLLSLHKNTLLYRLNRVREITGCDLSSGEDVFRLQLSFRLLLHLGLFHPRLRLERADLGQG